MSTTPAPLNTEQKIAVAGAIADGLLKPISGADDTSATAQGIAAGVQTSAQIAEVVAPQYAKKIELAASLEPVAYHAGLAIAHLLQHLFHHTVNQTVAPGTVAPPAK